jgi:hypothetical protein
MVPAPAGIRSASVPAEGLFEIRADLPAARAKLRRAMELVERRQRETMAVVARRAGG